MTRAIEPNPLYSSVIDSVGVYIPPDRRTTEETLRALPPSIRFPMAQLTGIEARSRAHNEYSIDLAEKAARDCFSLATVSPLEVKALIACNICRYDMPEFGIALEPSTSARLAQRLGLKLAWHCDLNNACSGIMTGLYLADRLIRLGMLENCLVVSGEYISHLSDVVENELKSLYDDRLACLTLGDAGGAILVRRSPNLSLGFQDFSMATLGRYSDLCRAYPRTTGPGYIMHTDSRRIAESGVEHSAIQIAGLIRKHGLDAEAIQHMIGHQASLPLLGRLITRINQKVQQRVLHPSKLITNLRFTGNTASTSQVVALGLAIKEQRFKDRDLMLLTSQASGLTLGSALYRFGKSPKMPLVNKMITNTTQAKLSVVGRPSIVHPIAATTSTLDRTFEVAKRCIAEAHVRPDQISRLIYAGQYKSNYMDEPAQAAILEGRLKGDSSSQSQGETFAFDLMCGPLAFLHGLFLLYGLLNPDEHGLIVTAETCENRRLFGEPTLGVWECAAAMLVQPSLSDGFSHFFFYSDLQFLDLYASQLIAKGANRLSLRIDPRFDEVLLNTIGDAVKNFYEAYLFTREDFDSVLVPFRSPQFAKTVADKLGFGPSGYSFLEGDGFSASIPLGLSALAKAAVSGEKTLVISYSPGIQIGISVYQWPTDSRA